MLEWIYNRYGKAVALYCGDCIYDAKGDFCLWVVDNNVYNMNGHHVGWIEGGVLYDSDNRVIGFTVNHTQGLPSTPGLSGVPGYPLISGRPGWPGLSGIPGRPGYSGWSNNILEDYIHR